jgi:hypothetical protein
MSRKHDPSAPAAPARSVVLNASPRGTASHARVAAGGPNRGPTTTFSDPGATTLPSLKLARDAVLHWTTASTTFSLSTPDHRLNITGKGHHGQGFAAAGIYKHVRVVTNGAWTLHVMLLARPS